MCYDDFDPCDIFDVIVPRARKQHRCDECRAFIFPGEHYARASWLADGSWSRSLRCAACYFLCEAIETLICGDHGMIPWGGGYLAEEIDGIGNDAEFSWAGDLFAVARYRLLEQIQ